jgi:hypothetical protein
MTEPDEEPKSTPAKAPEYEEKGTEALAEEEDGGGYKGGVGPLAEKPAPEKKDE